MVKVSMIGFIPVIGSYTRLIAQFDGVGPWWSLGACATQYTQLSYFKRLGECIGAERCTVKREFYENDTPAEREVVSYRLGYDGNLRVYDAEIKAYIPAIVQIGAADCGEGHGEG